MVSRILSRLRRVLNPPWFFPDSDCQAQRFFQKPFDTGQSPAWLYNPEKGFKQHARRQICIFFHRRHWQFRLGFLAFCKKCNQDRHLPIRLQVP
jgi:hypothetical protein